MYVEIVISNAFNLNKKKYFSFFLYIASPVQSVNSGCRVRTQAAWGINSLTICCLRFSSAYSYTVSYKLLRIFSIVSYPNNNFK